MLLEVLCPSCLGKQDGVHGCKGFRKYRNATIRGYKWQPPVSNFHQPLKGSTVFQNGINLLENKYSTHAPLGTFQIQTIKTMSSQIPSIRFLKTIYTFIDVFVCLFVCLQDSCRGIKARIIICLF